MTATTSTTNTQVSGSVGFSNTLASEWTKLTSVRSTYIIVALGIILSIGFSALIALVTGTTFDDWGPADRESYDPILFSFSGTLFSAILFAVLGVTMITSEYSSGMMGMTLTATPRRGRVFMAKVLILALVTLVAGFIVTYGSFFASQAIFSSYDMPTVGAGNSDAMRAMLTGSVLTPLFPVIGAALAVLMRSTAGAITTVLGLIFAPSFFGGLLPSWWQENVLSFLPGPASDSLILRHIEDSTMYPDSAGLAIAIVVAWLVIFVGGGIYLINKRDA